MMKNLILTLGLGLTLPIIVMASPAVLSRDIT